MIPPTAQELREQVHLLPMLILNPLTYERDYKHVCRAVARVLRIRLEGVGRVARRCDREGASLLRSASEASEQVRGERLPCRTHRNHGSLQPKTCKSVCHLGKSPRRSSRRCAGSVTVPYRVQAAAPRRPRNPIWVPKGRPRVCLYLFPGAAAARATAATRQRPVPARMGGALSGATGSDLPRPHMRIPLGGPGTIV